MIDLTLLTQAQKVKVTSYLDNSLKFLFSLSFRSLLFECFFSYQSNLNFVIKNLNYT